MFVVVKRDFGLSLPWIGWCMLVIFSKKTKIGMFLATLRWVASGVPLRNYAQSTELEEQIRPVYLEFFELEKFVELESREVGDISKIPQDLTRFSMILEHFLFIKSNDFCQFCPFWVILDIRQITFSEVCIFSSRFMTSETVLL